MIYRNDDPPECDESCAVCGKGADVCACPECPDCGAHGDPECFVEHELKNSDAIYSVGQLESKIGCLNIEKTIYKSTTSGAWVDLDHPGWIRMGSIVEGVDECTDVHELEFGKFTMDDFWSAVEEIETQALEIWNRTHGCEDCYPDDYPEDPLGLYTNPVNPECKTCEGYGEII